MTEAQWLATPHSSVLLAWARPRTLARKKRLLSVAACRLIALDDSIWRAAVDTSERFADGQASRDELQRARRRVQVPWQGPHRAQFLAARVCAYLSGSECCNALGAVRRAIAEEQTMTPEQAERELADLVREVFGNPFRPSAIDPACLAHEGGQAGRLARAIYDERAFDRLPILGDALEEAGCADGAVLGHLRDTAVRHVRGCWALDLALGRPERS